MVRRSIWTGGMLVALFAVLGSSTNTAPSAMSRELAQDLPCLFELDETGGCTHGPDPAPPGFDINRRVPPLEGPFTARMATSSSCEGGGVAPCEGDTDSGPRVQILYAVAADQTDNFALYVDSIRQWAADADEIIGNSAAKTGGARSIRFVQDEDCLLSVEKVVLSASGDDTLANTKQELLAQGFDRTDRIYLVFVDALRILCGVAYIYPDDRPGPSNRNNFGPNFARVDAGCWDGHTIAHELLHNFGAVQNSAPNRSRGYHCTDEYDVLCYSDEPYYPPMRYVCNPGNIHEFLLDCNNDDYFHTSPPPGSYLADHWNSADNVFLNRVPPPIRAATHDDGHDHVHGHGLDDGHDDGHDHVQELGHGEDHGHELGDHNAAPSMSAIPVAGISHLAADRSAESTASSAPAVAAAVEPQAPAQACGITGTVFEGSFPAPDITVSLRQHEPGVGRDRNLETVTTDADGRYRFGPAPGVPVGEAVFVEYETPVSAGPEIDRLAIWRGEDIALDGSGCGDGGDFDIANVHLVEPDDFAETDWISMYEWEPRILPIGIPRDVYQICFEDATTRALIDPCIPAGGVTGTAFTPSDSERPPDLVDDRPYNWFVKIIRGDGYGLSRWSRAITFTPIHRTPGTPTATPPPSPTPTATPTPIPGSFELCPGESVSGTIEFEIEGDPAPADVLLAFDATGSMYETIDEATRNADAIMNGIAAGIPNVQFGVMIFRDYTASPVHQVVQPITSNRGDVSSALASIVAGGGGMSLEEAYGRALYESYMDPSVGWRSTARRYVVMFGDQMPIDDDWNEGISAPTRNPGGVWCGLCYRDPGRDRTRGTADDIDFQHTLAEMNARDMTLLFVVAENSMLGLSWRSDMLHYWDQWVRWVNPAGDAVAVDGSATLATVIVDLVLKASIAIGHLELRADPPLYNGWLSVSPPERRDLIGGDIAKFDYTLTVPRKEPPGITHRIRLQAIADSTLPPVYEREVLIYVLDCGPPPTPVPPSRVEIAIPAATYRDYPRVFAATNRSHERVGPAGGRADTGIMVQNLDRERTLNALAYFYPQVVPYTRPAGNGPPLEYFTEVFGVPPGGSQNFYLPTLNLPYRIFSAMMLDTINLPLGAVVRTDWHPSGGAAIYSNVAPSYELSIPVVVREYHGQTSMISVMSDGNARVVHGEIEFYRSGSSTPVGSPVPFELEPFEGATFDLLDNHPTFNALGAGFLGSARIRLVYGSRKVTDTGAWIGAMSYVNIATSDRAIWGFEALPSGALDTRAANTLYVPLWRSRQCGPTPDIKYDTGIAVTNPNDRPVEAYVEFYPTEHESASQACRDATMFRSPTVTIEPFSNHVFYQGPGGGSYPNNCFGSAVVKTTRAEDTVHAVVNDSQNLVELSAAYVAIPIHQAHTKVAVPLMRSKQGSKQFTTGIQVMNASEVDVDVFIHFIEGTGSEAVQLPGCGSDCRVTIKPFESHTWWPPSVNRPTPVPGEPPRPDWIPAGTLGSALIESSGPIAVIVNDFPLLPGVDAATYNGIPAFDEPEPRR